MPLITSHQAARPGPALATPHCPPVPAVLAEVPRRPTRHRGLRPGGGERQLRLGEESLHDTSGWGLGDMRDEEGVSVGIVRGKLRIRGSL